MDRKRSCAMISMLIILVTLVSIYFESLAIAWDNYVIGSRFRSQPVLEDSMKYTGKKKVLFWNTMFGDKWFYMGETNHFNNCPKYNNCYATNVRDMFDITDFDAILFHGNELKLNDLPNKRDSRQIYVFANLESPVNRPLTDPFFENYFNATMTYRLDSDIPWPYNIIRNVDTGEIVAPFKNVNWQEPSFDVLRSKLNFKLEKKEKPVAWFVSNCWTYGKRESYVEELKKYIQVDVIGKCGEADAPECPHSKDCFSEIVEPNYFFYLSFENTFCDDYVTEKFFNPLRYYVVPVIYGGANYSLFAPPDSYIDALDFESPKDLAGYLLELSQNKEEYLKYFWWKKFYEVGSTRSLTLCNLCELLNEPKPPKTYSPLSNWLTKDKCPIQNALNEAKFATKKLRPTKKMKT